MAATTSPRNTERRSSYYFEADVAVGANAILYPGTIGMVNAAGFLVAGATATGQLRPCMVLVDNGERKLDATGLANGALRAKVAFGIFRFANSAAGDAITQAEIEDVCYIVDNQTVAKTDGTGTRSAAGKVWDVDAQGVWVLMAIK